MVGEEKLETPPLADRHNPCRYHFNVRLHSAYGQGSSERQEG